MFMVTGEITITGKHETETLAVSLASEIIEVLVIQTQEKTQQVMNTQVQYVVDTVEVKKSKIIEDTVQRMKPIIQEKISQVIKHTDFPQLQFLSKVVDMPVVGQQQATMVEKTQTTIHVPQAQVVEKTVAIPMLQIIKKAIEIPEIRTVWGTETSESLDTARTRQNDTRSKRQQHDQQHHNNQQQSTRQAMQQQTGEKERERRKRAEREKGRGAEKERNKEVKKDVTGWTVVTRNKKQRKTIQIFVKVNGSLTTPIEVNLTDDKVEDMLKRIQKDEDLYVTMHGRVLKRSERLKSCEVTDGCTIQVTDRLRVGGRHKDKRSRAETRQGMDASGQKDQQVELSVDKYQEMTKALKDVVIQPLETYETYQRTITMILEAEDEEHKKQRFGKQLQEQLGLDEERGKMEWRMRWAVEARKRREDAEQGQRRQEEQGQNTGQEQGKKGKQVRLGEEEETKETQAESTDEQKVMGRTTEVRTGRGSAGLVQGGDERCRADETRTG